MWRKPITQVGEFLESVLTLNTLLIIYGIAAGGGYIVNIIVGGINAPQTPLQTALQVAKTFGWLLLFFIVIYLSVRGLGRFLIWLGNYYPNWFYFPKLDLRCDITSNKEIELRITNQKFWQRITLRAAFYTVYKGKSRPSIRGVAPPDVKELLPLDTMTGKDARTKIIGRIIEDGMVLSTGNKNEEVSFTEPGFYYYEVSCNGAFRGRKYTGGGKIAIRITEDHKVDCA